VAELGGWVRVGTLPGPAPTAPPLRLVSPEVDVAPSFPPRKRLPELGSLRRRLVQSADLSARYLTGGATMDIHTANAVRLFQARHGLVADGVVGPRTLAALNAPVAGEIAQARVNLARGQDDRSALPRYVEVNVPGYELRVVEGGRVVLRSRVIVGDRKNATPIFDDLMRTIEVNPSWYVPRSIEAELVEKEAKKPGYLAGNGFYWRTPTHGGPDRLVQRPGPENALGRVKFLFPNHHAVYLHDTPQRGLFGRSRRSLSHGCVRVEKPFELALALLGPQGWDAKRLQAAFAGAKTRRIDLASPVPVFLDYRTAFVDEDGRLQLRADLYGHDAAGVTRFNGKGLPPDRPPELAAPPPAEAVQVSPLPPPVPTPAAFLGPLPAPRPL
jgi:murein L,D-transpeptidase YcbB/YkuD